MVYLSFPWPSRILKTLVKAWLKARRVPVVQPHQTNLRMGVAACQALERREARQTSRTHTALTRSESGANRHG